MSDLNLKPYDPLYPMRVHPYEELLKDQNASVIDKINSIIVYLNSVGKLTSDVVKNWNTVYNWVMNDGLKTGINNKLEDMLAKGEFNPIFNDILTKIGDITTLTTTDKSNLTKAINELVLKIGNLANLTTTDKTSLVNAINENTSQLAEIMYNAKSSGVKFDNVTDDITAINAAIQYVKGLGGGTVLLPRGYTKISSPIQIEDNVILKGSGRDVTFIVPTFTTGNVIQGITTTKQKPQVNDLSIKPASYQYGLIGINYKFFQYGSVKRVDVWNCGIGFDFDGTVGCYYNKAYECRVISCAMGVRTKDGGGLQRANANTCEDITIISPIIGVLHASGNTNIFSNIKVESLESSFPHPTIDQTGATVNSTGRWMLKITNGTASQFDKFRAEFDGNLVSLMDTYGHFLKDFYCIYNGVSGAYTALQENVPNGDLATANELRDVQLGYSSPSATYIYYNRFQNPTTAYNVRGAVKWTKNSITVTGVSIPAGGNQQFNISTAGLQQNDLLSLSTDTQVPLGLVVMPPVCNYLSYNITVYIYNPTTSPISIPTMTWTAGFVRA